MEIQLSFITICGLIIHDDFSSFDYEQNQKYLKEPKFQLFWEVV